MEKVAPPVKDEDRSSSVTDLKAELAKVKAQQADERSAIAEMANLMRKEKERHRQEVAERYKGLSEDMQMEARHNIEEAKREERNAHAIRLKEADLEVQKLHAKIKELTKQQEAQAAELQKLRELEKKSQDDGNTQTPSGAELDAQRLKLAHAQQQLEETTQQLADREADAHRAVQSRAKAVSDPNQGRVDQSSTSEPDAKRADATATSLIEQLKVDVARTRKELHDSLASFKEIESEARDAEVRLIVARHKGEAEPEGITELFLKRQEADGCVREAKARLDGLLRQLQFLESQAEKLQKATDKPSKK
jgi:hypothetical protein